MSREGGNRAPPEWGSHGAAQEGLPETVVTIRPHRAHSQEQPVLDKGKDPCRGPEVQVCQGTARTAEGNVAETGALG